MRKNLRFMVVISVCAFAAWSCSDSDSSKTTDGSTSETDGSTTESDVGLGFIEETDCAGLADGVGCGGENSGRICLSEACVTSTCGDGYVDTNNDEECEDDNDVDGDGCTVCKWDCEGATDCDDGNICNGTETCNTTTHRCEIGTQADDDTDCTLANETAGECNGGVCAAIGCGDHVVNDEDEECDDGNDISGDGCENDCTWTCEDSTECDDSDPCNGVETCNQSTHICDPGTAVVCDDSVCEGTCDSSSGECVYPDGDQDGSTCDEDCNDADSVIYPGAPECNDGKDNDCNAETADGADGECKCWEDSDDDTFAAKDAEPTTNVTCPEHYTSTAPISGKIDCADVVPDVHPGQTLWYTVGYCSDGTHNCAKPSFDYNCDGEEELRYTATTSLSACVLFSKDGTTTLCKGTGWVDVATVPTCGTEATYRACNRVEDRRTGEVQCVKSEPTRAQACR